MATPEGAGPWYLTTTAGQGANNKLLSGTAMGSLDNSTKTASVGTSGGGDYPMAPLNTANAKTTFTTTIQFKGWNFLVADMVGPAGSKRRIAAGTWQVEGGVNIVSGVGYPVGGTTTVRVNVYAATAIGGSRFLGTLSGTVVPASGTPKEWIASGSLSEVILETTETLHIEVWYTVPNASLTSYVLALIIGPNGSTSNAALTLPGSGLRYRYDTALTGSAGTPAGGLTKTALKPATGSAGTPAGALVRRVNKALAGSGTPAGALLKRANKFFTGSAGTPSGSLVKTTIRLLTGSAGNPSGSLRWSVTKQLAGSVTPSGSLTKLVLRTFTALITPAGTLRKVPAKPLTGALTPSPGTLVRSPVKSLTGSAGTPTGSLRWLIAKALSGELTSSGSLTKLVSVHQTGTASTAGALRNVPYKPLAGSLTPTGLLGRAVAKSFTGGLSPTATVHLLVRKYFTANITPTAVAVKFTLAKFFQGVLYGPSGDGSGGGGVISIIGRSTLLRRLGGVVPLSPGQIVPIEPAWYDTSGNLISPTGAVVSFRDFSTGSARYWTGTAWTSTPTTLPTTSGRYVLTVPAEWLGLVVAVTASLAGQPDLTDTYTIDDTVTSRSTATALAAVQADTDDLQASAASLLSSLATVLARVDVATSTRASQGSVTALGTPAQAAALSDVAGDLGDLSTSMAVVLTRLDTTLSTRAADSDMQTVLTDLATLLTRLDVAVSTRAAATDAATILTDLSTLLSRLPALRAALIDELDPALADRITRRSDLPAPIADYEGSVL